MTRTWRTFIRRTSRISKPQWQVTWPRKWKEMGSRCAWQHSTREHTALDPGVCGDLDALNVAQDLAQQASDPNNALFSCAATGGIVSMMRALSQSQLRPATLAPRPPLFSALRAPLCAE
jgi:hypothetical protein